MSIAYPPPNRPIPPSGVVLADNVVRLRQYAMADCEKLFDAAVESVAEVGEWLPWCHKNYTLDEAMTWIAARETTWQTGSEFSFAIEELATGAFVGGCGLNQFDYDRMRANLGYWIRTSATRRGFATRAARMLARWGAKTLGLERMEVIAAVGNVASQRVAVKTGAFREGIARSRIRIRERQHNAVVFSLIRSDVLP